MTPAQRDLLHIIQELMELDDGVCPSMQELADEMGLISRGSIHARLKALRDGGFIRWLPYRARSIEVLRRVPPREDFEFIGTFEPAPDLWRKAWMRIGT